MDTNEKKTAGYGKRHSNTSQEFKAKSRLSDYHVDPQKGVAELVRRRSSALATKEVEGSRRLSQLSSHSAALALEIKRKSLASLKSTREEPVEPQGQPPAYQERQDAESAPDAKAPPEQPEQMSFAMKIIYSMVMLYIHHNFGLSLSGFAPSFVDFKHMVKTTMTFIGLMPIFQAIGCVCGSLCGTLYKWLPRQLVLLTVISFMAFGTIFMPYATDKWHLYICIFFYGFGIGAWNNSNNVWLMEMWQDRAASVLLFSQAIYGVGTVLGPLVVRPYLTGEYESDFTNSTGDPDELARTISHKLKTPFLIDGIIEIIGPIMMLILYFVKPYKYTSISKLVEDSEQTEEEKAKQEARQRFIPKKTIIAAISLFMAFGFMTENMYMDFAPTFFQYVKLRLPAPQAADIASTMAIALTAGRGLCVFVAIRVRPQYMIIIHAWLIWIGVVVQYFCQDQLAILWFSAVLICYGYSCIYVSLYAFTNQYFEMTDSVGTIFIACYNSLYLFLPYFIGDNIETFPDILMYLMFGCVSVSIVVFTLLLIRIWRIPNSLLRS